MCLSPTLEEIIEIVKSFPLKDALTYLTITSKIVDFSKDGYGRLKVIIQDKQNEGKYAFVPDKSEANILLGFEKQADFSQIVMLVPNYRYIDLLRTGMLIDYYHKNDSLSNRERVKAIKYQLSKRPNSIKILKIVDLPTTPFFTTILKYLFELKKQGYAQPFLEEQFDSIIEKWDKTTKLVRKDDDIGDVMTFCKKQVMDKQEFFSILGMRTASSIVEATLSELEREKYLEKHGYKFQLTKSRDGNQPRTEVFFIKKEPY